jgi:hypothetical protein
MIGTARICLVLKPVFLSQVESNFRIGVHRRDRLGVVGVRDPDDALLQGHVAHDAVRGHGDPDLLDLAAVHGLGVQLFLGGVLGEDRHALAAHQALHVLADRDDDLVQARGMDVVGDFPHPPFRLELRGKLVETRHHVFAGFRSEGVRHAV